ncbi:WhiB family transcriptional regulator [Streptomyces cellulosae]|nr:WhiB family transcriptional regulator [Streptomyces cellulosae]
MTSLYDLMNRTPGLPCRTHTTPTTDPWFSTDPTERQDAARQCHRCPLLLACMQDALARREQHGVWGGVDFQARATGCGTDRGYRSHRSRGEKACPACQAAYDEAVEANRRRILAEAHAAGGTMRGYWMHLRLGEAACVLCKRACARQSQERRKADRAACERARRVWEAREVAEGENGPQAGAQPLPIAS